LAYFNSAYYVVPDGQVGQEAFAVIRDAIGKEGKGRAGGRRGLSNYGFRGGLFRGGSFRGGSEGQRVTKGGPIMGRTLPSKTRVGFLPDPLMTATLCYFFATFLRNRKVDCYLADNAARG
jgi:hypothetical protein